MIDIHERRLQLGLTLQEVGNACGVGKSTVRKWECGMISNMKRDKIALLAAVLQVRPVDLLNFEQQNSQPTEADRLALVDEITQRFAQLPADVQQQVMAYADFLLSNKESK